MMCRNDANRRIVDLCISIRHDACWVKLLEYDILKIGSDASCKSYPLETICMNSQILFSLEKKKKR